MDDEYYQTVVDKFIFTVKKGLLYAEDGGWVKVEKGFVRVGSTDFFQKRIGDIIFVEFPKVGIKVNRSEEIAQLESIKAVISITSPITGNIIEINQILDDSPEMINEEPYGRGWLVLIQSADPKELSQLLSAEKYFELMITKIADEVNSRKQESK